MHFHGGCILNYELRDDCSHSSRAVAPEAKATPTHQVANAEAATAVGLLATAAEGTEMARVAV